MSEKKSNMEFAGAATIEGMLARHFREVVRTERITEEKWNERMSKYLEAEGYEAHLLDSVRANLTKQLSESEMSWSTFCKGMKMLGCDETEIRISTSNLPLRITSCELFSLCE